MRYLKLLVLLSLPLLSYADGSIDAKHLLKRDLGDAIEFHQSEIQYCPDNTCELFRSKEQELLPAYVYLYLFHRSGTIYLKQSFGGEQAFVELAKEEPQIRELFSQYCKENSNSPNCILDGLGSSIGVELGSAGYDEGYYCYGYSENENVCEKL